MKRFSNLEIKEKILQTNPSKLERTVGKIVNENLILTMTGEDFVGKKITISGQQEFVNNILNLIKEQKEQDSLLMTESLRVKLHNNFDQLLMNKSIEQLYEMYDEIVQAPSPEDIFSSEDYEVQNDTMIIRSLNSIPEDFLDYINNENASKYFENKNTVRIMDADNGWHLFFTPATGQEYRSFVTENKEFIGDFIKATERLIGAKNLKIDRQLLANV